ncbi:MAG: class I SAM-dependent methyltransferase [Bacteriovoracaceae bacterium]|nr:class I SAM-dependent methyltransferase [Bacteriovoracaceae bacterium]
MLSKLIDNLTFNSMSSKAFSKVLGDASRSDAYLKFSSLVHGTNFKQFNLLDSEQFELLIKKLSLTQADNVLNLGCGLGELDAYLNQSFGCQVTGIDFAKDYLDSVKTPQNVKLIPGDINRIPNFEKQFSKIICLDSFYLLKNPQKVLNSIHKNLQKNGSFFLFYGQKVSKGHLPYWLEHKGFETEIMRFESWNTEFWKKYNQALETTRNDFIHEGNLRLWETKRREWDFQKPLIENNDLIRYFFIMKKID